MDVAGTPYYIAPEVLSARYGKECDVWSLGVLLYQMMTGEMPFDGNDEKEVFGKIKKGHYTYPKGLELSPEVIDLIRRMITVDKSARITVADALKHEWFKDFLRESMKLQEQHAEHDHSSVVYQNLMNYRKRSTLKNAAVNILVKHLDAKELQCLRDEFEKIDKDGSGYIEIDELREALTNRNLKQSTEEIQAIIDQLDYANNDKINYTEFIAATIDVRKIINQDERKLKAIFNSFDVDNTGGISRENLKLAFSKYGRLITDQEIDDIMKMHDKKHTDFIDFQEFKVMVFDDLE